LALAYSELSAQAVLVLAAVVPEANAVSIAPSCERANSSTVAAGPYVSLVAVALVVDSVPVLDVGAG
jgi:hypothetical protein